MTGSIAVYKTAGLASALVRKGVKVHTLITEDATRFINPMTFESLTGNKRLVDTFDRNFEFNAEHMALAKQADVVMTAPASANVIGKITHGIAGDMLTTIVMAYRYKKTLAPAINTNVYENSVLQGNLDICRRRGMKVITPAQDCLACGGTRAEKTPEPKILYEYILWEAGYPEGLADRRVLMTTGPIRESTDPVCYITDHSMGRMGYAIARVATYREADVALVSDPVSLDRPLFVEMVPAGSAREMFEAVTTGDGEQDIIVKAAAVADYQPFAVGTGEIKKSDGDLSIALEWTGDTLGWLGQNWENEQLLCGLSMETQNMLENSRAKLTRKQVDMIVANNLRVEGMGFGMDTNAVTLITRESETRLSVISKEEVADRPLAEILKRTKGQGRLNPA